MPSWALLGNGKAASGRSHSPAQPYPPARELLRMPPLHSLKVAAPPAPGPLQPSPTGKVPKQRYPSPTNAKLSSCSNTAGGSKGLFTMLTRS